MQPDIWDPFVKSYYDIASAGAKVDAFVSWWDITNHKMHSAWGAVHSFDDNSGEGLRGDLNSPFEDGEDQFDAMELTITRPSSGARTNAVVTLVSSGRQRLLEDAYAGHTFWMGVTMINEQFQAEDLINIDLVNVFAYRNFINPLRIRDLVAADH